MSLPTADLQTLATALADQAATAGDPAEYLRDLVANRATLPDRWRREVVGRRADNLAIATRNLVRWAETKGRNPADPRYTTLGSLLEPLLEDVGPDVAAGVVALIVARGLYPAPDVLDDLTGRYQVPTLAPAHPAAAEPGAAEALALQGAAAHTPLLLEVDSLAAGIRRAASVCRIEVGPAAGPEDAIGSGFVVGPDAVLTAAHVVDAACGRPIRLRLRSTSHPGGVLVPARDESVRPVPGLDLALLRTAGALPPGTPPLPLAGAPVPRPGDPLAILQHPDGGTLRLAVTANGVASVDPARHAIRYATYARHGSSGGPCFDAAWRVVAVHLAERSTVFGTVREGVLLASITWRDL